MWEAFERAGHRRLGIAIVIIDADDRGSAASPCLLAILTGSPPGFAPSAVWDHSYASTGRYPPLRVAAGVQERVQQLNRGHIAVMLPKAPHLTFQCADLH